LSLHGTTQRKKENIAAPKAVMLNDGKQLGIRGRPKPIGAGVINHYQDQPDGWKERWKGFGPPGGEDRQSLEWCPDAGVQPGVVASGL